MKPSIKDEQLLSQLFEGAYVVDKNRKIIYWNTASETITGYGADDVVDHHCYANILQHISEEGVELCRSGCPLHRTLKTGESQQARVYLRHKEGHRIPVSIKSMPIYDDKNIIVAALELFSDERHRKVVHEDFRALQNKVMTDDLTKIPNRRFLDFNLKQALDATETLSLSVGLLFIDIDHFKKVNDTYGHTVGDEILSLVARSLESNLRTGDIITRFGGEEFVGMFKNVSLEHLTTIAEKLRMVVAHSAHRHQGEQLRVTISIGGTLLQKNDTVETFLQRADKHMYDAKINGRDCVVVK